LRTQPFVRQGVGKKQKKKKQKKKTKKKIKGAIELVKETRWAVQRGDQGEGRVTGRQGTYGRDLRLNDTTLEQRAVPKKKQNRGGKVPI